MISKVEQEELLSLYKNETGNPIEGPRFRLTEYIDWLEERLINFIKQENLYEKKINFN